MPAFAVPAAVGALTVHASGAVAVPLLVLAGAAEGVLLGWFQARVLKDVVPGLPIGRWTVFTAGAASLAWLIGLLPAVAGAWFADLPAAVLVPVVAIAGTALLASIGTAQRTVLRDHVTGAGRWIWGTAAAWLVALAVFVTVTTPPGQAPFTVAVIGALGGKLMAATLATLTGLLVVRIVHTDRRPTGTGYLTTT